jgi:hypothetical protein
MGSFGGAQDSFLVKINNGSPSRINSMTVDENKSPSAAAARLSRSLRMQQSENKRIISDV